MIRAVRLAFAAGLAVVVYGSVSAAPFGLHGVSSHDKTLHLAGYCALAAVGSLGWPRARPALLLALPLFGLALEVAQMAAPGRGFEWMDALTNAAGVGVAVALTAALTRGDRRRVCLARESGYDPGHDRSA